MDPLRTIWQVESTKRQPKESDLAECRVPSTSTQLGPHGSNANDYVNYDQHTFPPPREPSSVEEMANPSGGHDRIVTAPSIPQFVTVPSSPMTSISEDRYGSTTPNTYIPVGPNDYSDYPGNTHDSYSVGKFGTCEFISLFEQFDQTF
ncbi:hypothetical protein Aduo_004626 [Ancylostoma duodenale]